MISRFRHTALNKMDSGTSPRPRIAPHSIACSQWSRIWKRYTIGSLAGMLFQRPRLSHYPLTNIAKPARRYDVYVHAQQVLQIGHEPGQIEERPALVHVNQEIDVAVLPVVSAGHRTKDTNIAGAVQFGELEDVRLLLGPQCFQGDHVAYLYCRLPRQRFPVAVAYNTSSDHPSSTCLALVMNWSASAPSIRRWSKLSEGW